ncbi:hypothetical protein GIB67_040734 [Kingdonia uniflora]|uniref:DYW domain-containing protein n=1 Tax=Kingdonia uniflora TaxID=39325 RepID=A0A7J7KUC8_9MAGN|nr:hypothetical protein GIB67_040734 [Kingdonia uniflora]
MVTGYSQNGEGVRAIECFREMHRGEVGPNQFTFPSVLKACSEVLARGFGIQVHGCIVRSGFACNVFVDSALVDMYAKCGDFYNAKKVFHSMEELDVVSWTSLITGYAHYGSHEEALVLYCDMRVYGFNPDQFIIACVFSACAELTVLGFGQQVQGYFVRSGLKSSLSVNNSLVTLYAKCGCLEDASQVFDLMEVRDVVSWTALIVGHAQNGKGEVSLQLYDHMIRSNIEPDFVTFVGLLFACSHTGLVEDGRGYFKLMSEVYGIAPGPQHYACMIDLLGRSGNIGEAKELLNQMTTKPDATVWKSILAACRMHRDLELGEIAARNLFELEPRNSMPYVMLSNIYSAAGKWDDVARLRSMMKSSGISKEPGYSWMEINNEIHTFTVEDRSHPRMLEIYCKVDEMMMLIKKAGYVPDRKFSLQDMDEGGKELGLTYHSEKLAVAYGLLIVSSGVPIRIFKNLRVCGDCHNAIKMISRVFQRHIILRDTNCFHHLREGVCSCRDYW